MRNIMEGKIEGFREGILIFDAALLYELGLGSLMDVVVLVRCKEETLLRRSIESKGYNERTVMRILASQMPQEGKARRADEIIENDGTLEELDEKARDVWKKLTGRRGARYPMENQETKP
jgi:dephospho-CoA kinase